MKMTDLWNDYIEYEYVVHCAQFLYFNTVLECDKLSVIMT